MSFFQNLDPGLNCDGWVVVNLKNHEKGLPEGGVRESHGDCSFLC